MGHDWAAIVAVGMLSVEKIALLPGLYAVAREIVIAVYVAEIVPG